VFYFKLRCETGNLGGVSPNTLDFPTHLFNLPQLMAADN
jgi:hypothetical protein